jgi:hypothetical protein
MELPKTISLTLHAHFQQPQNSNIGDKAAILSRLQPQLPTVLAFAEITGMIDKFGVIGTINPMLMKKISPQCLG